MVQLEEKGKEQTTEQVTPTTPTEPTAPPLPTPPLPPYPQEPTQPIMGQYPLLEDIELGDQVGGTFKVTLNKHIKKEPKRRKSSTPRAQLPMEKPLLSDTESTDGLIADEEDEEAEAPEIDRYRTPRNRRVSGGAWTADMELMGLISQEEAPPIEEEVPPTKRRKDQRHKQLKVKNTKPHYSSCHDLPVEEIRHPQKTKQERLLRCQSTPGMNIIIEKELQCLREEWLRQRATPSPPPGSLNEVSAMQIDRSSQSPKVESGHEDMVRQMQEMINRTNEKLDQMSQEIETLEEEIKQPQGPTQEQQRPNAKPTKEHITIRLQGTMETDKGRTEEIPDIDTDLAPHNTTVHSGSLSPEGMTLRNGRVIKVLKVADEENEDSEGSSMYPIITKTSGRKQYEPWPFMDMIGLAERLPILTDGADKWILALEETTAGIRLAVGDIKAILMYVAGKQNTKEIFTDAGLSAAYGTNINDGVEFGGYRSRVWEQLRKHYPGKRDPSKLEGETLGEDECPSKFLHNFQKRWKEETGEAWNANKTTQSLFKMMVKKAMPEEVQRRLEGVVGLMKMEWPLFTEHIVHHVELYKKDKKKKEEDDKQLANKLTQLQLGELSKLVKKEKEKAKVQAPMVMATQATPQNGQSQAPPQPTLADSNTTGNDTAVNATHHHHYYQHRCQEVVAVNDPPEGGAEEETVDGEGAETTHQATSRDIRNNSISNQDHLTWVQTTQGPIRLHLMVSVGGVDSQATYELNAPAIHGKVQHKTGPTWNSHALGRDAQRSLRGN